MEIVKRILIIIMFCAAMLFLLTFPGCRTKEYVPVHTTDTLYVAKIERDSVFVKDSTYVITMNDTVYFTKYINQFKYIDRIDTVYKSKIDTIIVQKQMGKVLEVEKKLGVVDRVLIFLGLMFLILIILKLIKIIKN